MMKTLTRMTHWKRKRRVPVQVVVVVVAAVLCNDNNQDSSISQSINHFQDIRH